MNTASTSTINNPVTPPPPPAQSAPEGMSEDTKTIVTVLLLIFAYPIGLILMWVWTKWKTWIKILITLLILPFIIIFISILSIGILSTVNTQEQMIKGQCISSCSKSDNVNSCVNQCMEQKGQSPIYPNE